MKDIKKVEVRHLLIEDYYELKASMIQSYEDMDGSFWKEHHIQTLLTKFPDGQIVVVADNKVVGSALSIIVNSEDFDDDHTYVVSVHKVNFS